MCGKQICQCAVVLLCPAALCITFRFKSPITVVTFVGKWITASVIRLSTKKQPEHDAPTKLMAYQTIKVLLFSVSDGIKWIFKRARYQGFDPYPHVSRKPKAMEKSGQSQHPTWTLGIDVSRESIDACLIRNADGQFFGSKFHNNISGFR